MRGIFTTSVDVLVVLSFVLLILTPIVSYLIEGGGVEDYVSFTKLLIIRLLLILKILFHQKELLLIDYELVRYIVHFLPGPNDFNLHFFHIAYLNGIYSIQNFKILFLYRPSNVHYYFLFAPMHHLFILSIILED